MILTKQNLLGTTRTSWTILLLLMALCIVSTHGAKNKTLSAKPTELSTYSESTEITDLETKEEPYPSVWAMMYDFWNWMIGGQSESKFSVGEPRTFGKIRRLQMALIPIVFKFGVISAMVTVLVFLALKTVFLLKMLLFLNAGAILAKILTYKSDHYQQQPSWAGYNTWYSAPTSIGNGWAGGPSQNKEIHLHIHNGNAGHQVWEKSDYSGYSGDGRHFDAANELNNPGPLPYLRAQYPNHRPFYPNGGR